MVAFEQFLGHCPGTMGVLCLAISIFLDSDRHGKVLGCCWKTASTFRTYGTAAVMSKKMKTNAAKLAFDV